MRAPGVSLVVHLPLFLLLAPDVLCDAAEDPASLANSITQLVGRASRQNGSRECRALASRAAPLWLALREGLLRVQQPAVLLSCSCGQWRLLQNLLCGLQSSADGRLAYALRHVLVVALDKCISSRLEAHFPAVASVALRDGIFPVSDGAGMAAAGAPDFALFAVLKTWLPYASAAMGFVTLTHDVDTAWAGDVLAYTSQLSEATGADILVTADSPLSSYERYPCGALYWERARPCPKVRPCHVQQINSGFLHVRPSASSMQVLSAWIRRCPFILRDGNDQPHLQHAIAANIKTSRCSYVPDHSGLDQEYPGHNGRADHVPGRVRRHVVTSEPIGANAAADGAKVAVLSVDRFVVGRTDEVWLASTRWARPALLHFHANYGSKWRDKCSKLARVGLLHLHERSSEPHQLAFTFTPSSVRPSDACAAPPVELGVCGLRTDRTTVRQAGDDEGGRGSSDGPHDSATRREWQQLLQLLCEPPGLPDASRPPPTVVAQHSTPFANVTRRCSLARLKGVDERYRDFLGALGFVHRGLWQSVVPDARGGAWGHLPLTFDAPLAHDHDGMARMFDDAMRSRRPLALLGPMEASSY